MKTIVLSVLVAIGTYGYLPALAESPFDEAKLLWEQSKNKPGYSEYQQEFVQYNNHLRLDTKNDCASRATGVVNMYLIISEKAVVESVVADRVNAKALCYQEIYKDLPVKEPPFAPFVIKMNMQ